jgi:hypothetical protein
VLRIPYTARPIANDSRIYCDTSFLLDLFADDLRRRGSNLGLSGTVTARIQQVTTFFADASANGNKFFTSLLAIEEAFHALLSREIKVRMRRANPPFTNWKDFRVADRSSFDEALKVGRTLINDFDGFTKAKNIDVLSFAREPNVFNLILEQQVIAYGRGCLTSFEAECMDAFQFASMRRFGFQYAASSDPDWLIFPFGSLYTAA